MIPSLRWRLGCQSCLSVAETKIEPRTLRIYPSHPLCSAASKDAIHLLFGQARRGGICHCGFILQLRAPPAAVGRRVPRRGRSGQSGCGQLVRPSREEGGVDSATDRRPCRCRRLRGWNTSTTQQMVRCRCRAVNRSALEGTLVVIVVCVGCGCPKKE